MTIRVLQLTDLHLMADPLAELKGICTRTRFDAVMRAASEVVGPVERLIITGDLAHDEKHETYSALRNQLQSWLPKLRIIPGNHDDRRAIRQTFGERIQVASDRIVFVDAVAGWTLIGLDSQVTGELRGELGSAQLHWLEQQLASRSDQSIALFVHHPPVLIGSLWIDAIRMDDADSLWLLLDRYKQVRIVCCGHIHQEQTIVGHSAIVLTTPSTGVQFQPESESLVVDSVWPGFRVLDLEPDGTFRTHVIRVSV